MVKKVSVVLVDDLDGGNADQTLTFAIKGATYEVDLSDRNAARLEELLAPYVKAGRRTGAGRRSAKSSGDAAKIRQWARTNGIDVTDRGRVSAEVREKYTAAHR